MKAMVLKRICRLEENQAPLELVELPRPVPGEGEILLQVTACGVCHTGLDEIEGRTPPPHFPMVLGHQVVGKIHETRSNAFEVGDRVGVAWIYSVSVR
jgi:propanol-preferring alcohol dehydrogenase